MNNLTSEKVNEFVSEFYTESLEDIVGLFSIAKEVGELIDGEEDAREQTLLVVGELLDRGMLAGDPPYHPGGYKPWVNQDRKAVIDRIRSEWIALGHRPDIPNIAWFGPPEEN